MDSLFHHRSCPVNLLFAVDNESEIWITAYLKLRDFDSVSYSFHSFNISESVTNATKQTGFRGGTPLMKLETHNIFPHVEDLMLVDFDMVFANDICKSAHAETLRMNEVR
jgi:hypothetical protein